MLRQCITTAKSLRRKKRATLLENSDMWYVGIGFDIQRHKHIYRGMETFELDQFADEQARRRKLCSEGDQTRAVQTRKRTVLAPFPPNALAGNVRYLTLSFDTDKRFLREIMFVEVKKESWNELFKLIEEQCDFIRTLCGEKKLC